MPIGIADLRAALPTVVAPVIVPFGEDNVAFPPTEGGIAATAANTTSDVFGPAWSGRR